MNILFIITTVFGLIVGVGDYNTAECLMIEYSGNTVFTYDYPEGVLYANYGAPFLVYIGSENKDSLAHVIEMRKAETYFVATSN